MDDFDWIREHLDNWDLEEEYIEYFKNVVGNGTSPYK
jgi:hypothetical protein